MKMITGSYNKKMGSYSMHSPEFPYETTVYMGYSLTEMKRKYRADNDLQGKHLTWIILGLEEK